MSKTSEETLDEKELLRVKIQYAPGLLAKCGEAVLTTHRLSFHPSRIDRIAGAGEWSLSLFSIERAIFKDILRSLVIFAGSRKIVLKGRSAGLLHERLQGMLQELGRALDVVHSLRPAELILLQDRAELHDGGLLSIPGEIVLTTENLTFKPDPFDRLLLGSSRLDAPVSSIRSLQLVPIKRRLFIETVDRSFSIGGSCSTLLSALLSSLQEEQAIGFSGTDIFSLECALRKDVLEHPGWLVVNSRGLRFTPSSRLDALIGASTELHLPFAGIGSMEVTGRMIRLLRVFLATEHYSFHIPDAEHHLNALLPRWASIAWENEPSLDERGCLDEESTRTLTDAWSEACPRDQRASPLLAGPVLWQQGLLRAERGWVILESGLVTVLRGIEPGCSKPVLLREADLLDPRKSDILNGILDLQVPGGGARGIARGGQGFAELFWSTRPKRSFAPTPSMEPRKKKIERQRLEHERRQCFRATLPEPLPVDIVLTTEMPVEDEAESDTEESFKRCCLRDLSVSGAGVYSDERVALRTHLRVRLSPDVTPIEAAGEVVFLRSSESTEGRWRLGICFQDMEPETERRIELLWTAIQRAIIQQGKDPIEFDANEADIGEIDLDTDPEEPISGT